MKKIFQKYTGWLIAGPLFKIIEAIFELIIPMLLSQLIEKGMRLGDMSAMRHIALRIFILYVTGFMTSIISQYISANVSHRIGKDIKDMLYAHVLHLPQHTVDAMGTAALTNRVTADVNQVQTGINMFIRLGLRAPLLVIGSIIMAATINLKISLIFVGISAVIALVLWRILKVTAKEYHTIQRTQDGVTKEITNQAEGARIIRAFSTQKREYDFAASRSNQVAKALIRLEKLQSLLNPITFLLMNGAIVGLLYAGGVLAQHNAILTGDLVALVNYLNQTMLALIVFVNVLVIYSKSLVSYRRVKEVLNLPEEAQAGDGTDDSIRSLAFENVSFGYREKVFMKDVSFTVNAGQVLAVTGATGSGKSMIAKLTAGLYAPNSGRVLLNGVPLQDYKEEFLKENLSIVFQKPELFAGTIADNITCGGTYTKEEIDTALEIAQAKDFVSAYADGTDHPVAEKGKNLSGGQKQRIAIARAVVKSPTLLILDDASSALDLKTEHLLYKALEAQAQDRILVIISNRISAIRHADQILVLNQGRLQAAGQHDALVKNCTLYRELCASQGLTEVRTNG